jgi:peptidoglycan/xylan/chitin deacetylase (PgdA/CDA1 family)
MRRIVNRNLEVLLRPVVRFRGDSRSVYLTFDDGPHPQRTSRVLAALERAGAAATFFMTGAEAQKHPQIARDVIQAGHVVGYHAHNHRHMRDLSTAEQLRELRAVARLEDLLGQRVRLYRPPYGELTLAQVAWCVARRTRIVMWSLESGDSFSADAAAVAERTRAAMRGGDIVLLHDDTAAGVDGLPLLLEGIRQAGLSARCL